MFKSDFSDLQRNGYRISQFRLIYSQDMRSNKYNSTKKVYKSSEDILNEKGLVIKHLSQKIEINFTVYYFSFRLMCLFITVTLLLLVSNNKVLVLPIISALLSLFFYILAYRHKENLVLGHIGINLAECIYDARIKEVYNF
jgi:hypothetical protein